MVTVMQGNFLAIVAIVAVSLLIARELVRATIELRHKARALEVVSSDLDECFSETDRLMCDERVPTILKHVLGGQLMSLARPEIGGPRMRAFMQRDFSEETHVADEDNPITEAFEQLARIDPKLADDCRMILARGFFALMLMHVEGWKVEVSVRDAVRSPYGLPLGMDRLFGNSDMGPIGPAAAV
ncbi:hypothetical protein Q8W71_17520 [Methylobacterium sp. NEAU 140]|uniref:hypothetical protein n=1 Tax=Methylobacterium sp. NEAU 140 TaxID=3064945 RepID=UPI002736E294|nr:hypothetical protein [Methylobacterium sp. NEAU 140]MDP4024427.1 hypothetical protein [Methylobacterium sp. NEAU 140]